VKKIGNRSPKSNLEGNGIKSLHAHLGKILELALQIGRRILDLQQLVGIGTADLWIQQPFPRIHKVLGMERHSIRPNHPGFELKTINLSAFGNCPAGGQCRQRAEQIGPKSVQGIYVAGKPFHHVVENHHRIGIDRAIPIEL